VEESSGRRLSYQPVQTPSAREKRKGGATPALNASAGGPKREGESRFEAAIGGVRRELCFRLSRGWKQMKRKFEKMIGASSPRGGGVRRGHSRSPS